MLTKIAAHLEVMLTKIEQFNKPSEGMYDSSVDVPDELAPSWKLGSKISLVNDEMKVSMVLIKERVKNEFELIKNGSNTQNFGDTSSQVRKSPYQYLELELYFI